MEKMINAAVAVADHQTQLSVAVQTPAAIRDLQTYADSLQ
jgi:hypothetical protein